MLRSGGALQTRIEMKLFSIFVALLALCGPAIAQPSECKSIPDSAARLACYDRATSAAPRPVVHASPVAKSDGAGSADSISKEDALMNERIKGICRGC